LRLLLHWFLSALALLLVAQLVPGFHVSGITSALLAVVVIAFVNGTLGLVMKILTFPFTVLTFGFFLLVVNAAMLKLAAGIVPGFYIIGLLPALFGAIVLAALNVLIRAVLSQEDHKSKRSNA